MRADDPRLASIVSLAATVLTAAFVTMPPTIFFAVEYERTAGALQAEAEINSRIISQIVSDNPELWQYEQVRFSEYLARRPTTGERERRRVVDAGGALVAESADPLPAPRMTRSVPLFDAGVPVARIEISRSLQPLLAKSGILAVALLAVGLVSFRMVRTIPLRAVARSQEALRRERDTAQRYLDVAGVAFVMIGEDGRVTLLNRRGCELLGVSEQEALSRDWTATFVEPSDRARVAAAISGATGPDDVVRMSYAVVRPSGERRLVSWYLTPLFDEERRRTGVLASGVDVTHEAQLEDQLRRAQKLEAIGRLAAGIAHDFTNVLALIRMKAEMLRRHVEERDPRRRYVDDILGSTERGTALTRDLLTFGRQRVVSREPIDLVELLRRFEGSLRSLVTDRLELRIVLPPEPLPVLGEPPQLERVLMNLVTNARDATPAGGRVVVSAARTPIGDPEAAGVERAGDYAELSVADTGAGIRPEDLTSLFEPFFTTKEHGKGTGLGLSIAYAIVKQHGGHIRVASEPGQGATFTVLLPLAPRAGAPDAAKA